MTTPTGFPLELLEATVRVFNAYPWLLDSVHHIALDYESLSFVLQEGPSAVVLHVFPDETADVIYVGAPTSGACEQLARLCATIGATWRRHPYSTRGLEAAFTELVSRFDEHGFEEGAA